MNLELLYEAVCLRHGLDVAYALVRIERSYRDEYPDMYEGDDRSTNPRPGAKAVEQ